jgi:Lactonase, 7-bladed beta-propeller
MQFAEACPADFKEQPAAADLHVTPDDRVLYGSERKASTLAGYRSEPEKRTLPPIGHFPTEKTPPNAERHYRHKEIRRGQRWPDALRLRRTRRWHRLAARRPRPQPSRPSEALAAGGTDMVVVAGVLRPRRRSVANPDAVDLGNLSQAAGTAEPCRAAPVLADLTGLPPARLIVGNLDPLLAMTDVASLHG